MAEGEDDPLKKAGSFFKKLGSQIADGAKTVADKAAPTLKTVGDKVAPAIKTVGDKVAQTSKQVTGLGRGDIKLEIEQTKLNPGDTVKGKLSLALTEKVDAKQIVVELRARQRFVATSNVDSSARTHQDVYSFVKELAPAGSYEQEWYDFELTVPSDALELKPQQAAGSNPVAEIARTVVSAVTPNAGPVEWDVVGKVVISWGRDITATVDLSVVR